MGDDSTFSEVVSATNENITRLTKNLAITASTVMSGGSEHTMAAPSAYHRAMTDVVTYRKRMLASKIKDVSPRQAIRQSLVQRIGGVRAPQIPDELLVDIPKPRTVHSLFQTFEATVPNASKVEQPPGMGVAIRKEMAASELMEIDEKIAELRNMRKLVFDRMAVAELEQSSDEPTLQHYYPSGERIKQINPPPYTASPIVTVDFNSPFGQLALTRGDDIEIHELSRDTNDFLTCQTIGNRKGKSKVHCLVIYGSEATLVGGVGSNINIWSPQLSTMPSVLTGHVGDVIAIDYDGESVVSASLDSTVRTWDERLGRNTTTIDMYQYGVCRALQHTGSALATGSDDGIVRLFDLRSSDNRPQRELRGGHISAISALQFNGLEMISGAMDGSVRVWDLRSGQVSHTEAYSSSITSMGFDSTKIVTSVEGEQGVHVYSRTTGEHRMTAIDSFDITSAKYMKGYLVTGRDSGHVGVWAV